jgi:hypothetical protein
MHPSVENAIASINNPEVQSFVQQLSKYGLGVSVPHMHDEESLTLLPENLVVMEEDLRISFHPREDFKELNPVAWRWNENAQAVSCYQGCMGFTHGY